MFFPTSICQVFLKKLDIVGVYGDWCDIPPLVGGAPAQGWGGDTARRAFHSSVPPSNLSGLRCANGADLGFRRPTSSPSSPPSEHPVRRRTKAWLGGLALSKANCGPHHRFPPRAPSTRRTIVNTLSHGCHVCAPAAGAGRPTAGLFAASAAALTMSPWRLPYDAPRRSPPCCTAAPPWPARRRSQPISWAVVAGKRYRRRGAVRAASNAA